MEFSEKALVLRVGRFREIDAWVRLFSPSRGMYTAFAFGGCRSRRRFCGCLDVFNHVHFKVKTGRAYHTLLEGRLVNGHGRLRAEPGRLGMAVNCLKFFEAVEVGPHGARAAHDLLLEALATLTAETAPSRLFPLYFRAKVACDQGFFPPLAACHGCGAPSEDIPWAVFHVEEGRLLCPACPRPVRGTFVRLGRDAMRLLSDVRSAGPADWGGFEPSPGAAGEFSRLLDRFVTYHLGLSWEHGTFVKN
ncbi:DNA repair protein RecO [Desulfolutivibrio sulfoxidireducens]|uniref:DNA repair protein RecO n=1 Tax=Desulfolutivibrio sulfoxidireducens TaxID=2773299 RepID=UPI00159D534A|nr:recombination protein O N-terminal domain-containing protein [Desulfolutivibrio sulfoxidireducens]QLA16443.1 DNA repair protein RecO [Desulfolutivibrio sulfoxidireducens]QLA19676.1 DNA repair protein RecO [Desulfolutivibrio sulfoxidireducens]